MSAKKILTMMMGLVGLNGHAKQTDVFVPIYGFPTHEPGIGHGVSACYAGGIGNTMVMVGGCNFPEDTLAPDSKKRFYKGIYVAHTTETDSIDWQLVGVMPHTMAYGVGVVCDDALVTIGGTNDDGSLNSVYRITLTDGQARVTTLPSLPHAMDNMAGALVGRRLYVAGGMLDGRATNRVFRMDMDRIDEGWEDIPPFPGMARVQPIAGSVAPGRFGVFGGFVPASDDGMAALAMDGCVYDEATGEWTMCKGPTDDRDESLFVGGGVALNVSNDSLVVMGGVNKEVFLNALNSPQPDYLSHPEEWYRFNPYTLLYNAGVWQVVCQNKATARAGAALVSTAHGLYVIGGELKPRVRTNVIYRFAPRITTNKTVKTHCK